MQNNGAITSHPVHVELVTIPALEYENLLDCRRRLDEISERLAALAKAPRSPMERDEQVATFISEQLGKMHVDNLLTACLEQFGWKRTPSKSAVYRYWKRLREGTSKPV